MSATKISQKIVLTTEQILAAYEKHGDGFMIIDFDNLRAYKSYSQYIDINIKLDDDTVKSIRYWRLSAQGITTGSRIKAPDQRRFEQVRICLKQLDDNDVETDNMMALKIICETYERIMKKYRNETFITDDEKAPRKQPDGKYRPIYLISTKVVSPMQTTAKNKEGDIIDLEYPNYWISLTKKRFYRNSEEKKESIQLDGKYYIDEQGSPDLDRPIMSFEYEPTFYNMDDFYHHPRTGKKIFKQLGEANEEENTITLDNTNIHNFITKGSAIVGNLKFEVAVSGRQAKLDIKVYGANYVKCAEQEEYDGNQEDDRLGAFGERYKNLNINGQQNAIDVDNIDDDDDDEY